MKLFLKGERCFTDKCSFERRSYPPGQHGLGRVRSTSYGDQLREKQKTKRIYGVLERQFRRYFEMAEKMKGVTGSNLLILLERRLDNVVYRLGFARSRAEARQLVNHGHILVNGRKVDIPSYLVRPGDVVEVREKSREMTKIQAAMEQSVHRGIPPWLERKSDEFKGVVRDLPRREDIKEEIKEHLIVELYSK